MANESTPTVAGTENASFGPTIIDIYQNLTLANLKKGLTAIEQEYVRREMSEQRKNLQTVKAVKESLVMSEELTQSPVLDQRLENVAVAISKQAIKATAPGAGAQKNSAEGADPVDLATGQLVYTFDDLHLDGAGINFDFTRRYRSKGLYPNGPLGACWDYSLNLWLREISLTEVVLNSVDFREDHFNLVQGTNDGNFYYAPPDGYHAILENHSGTYVLTRPDGMRYEYISPDNSIIYKISKIIDRFDNFLSFDYSDPSTLRIIVNDKSINPTRVVQIRFDDLKRIIAMVDYSGRSVTYNYNDYDDLTSVTLPSTKDYLQGRSFFYEYSSEWGPVAHQLLSVGDADGRRYLEIEYGKNENFIDHERVTRQRDDEGEWLIQYADLIPDDPDDITKPNRYAVTFKPTGHCVEYWFNKNGNALVKAETIFDENNIKSKFITRTLYNLDGNIIAQLSPGKQFTQYIYGRDLFEHVNASGIIPTKDERKTFGNLLTQIKRFKAGATQLFDAVTGTWTPPSPFTVFDPEDIIIDYTYESSFQQIATKSDPRFRLNANFFTKFKYTANGELEQVIYPETTGPDRADTSRKNEIDFFTYKASEKGKIFQKSLKYMDPLLGMVNHPDNHITEYTYFSQADTKAPEQKGIPELLMIPASNITLKGHVSAVTLGKGEADESKTTFKVNTRGVNVKITDARLNSTENDVDSNDQPASVKKNLSAAVAFETNFKYTREGKIKLTTRKIMDENGNLLLADAETTRYKYNEFGLMVSQRLGGTDFKTTLLTKKIYNADGLPERVISPTRSVTVFRHDPRRMPTKTIMGFGTENAVVSEVRYNEDGQKKAEIDTAGNTTRYDYDSFGRLVCTVKVVDIAVGARDKRTLDNRQGHTGLIKYDKLNNAIEERFFEWQQPNTYKLLTVKQYEYDERGRKIKTINYLFDAIVIVNTGINWKKDLFTVAIPNAIPVESWIFYDGNGKIKEQRDGVVTLAGQQTSGSSITTEYDHSGRVVVKSTRLPHKKIVVSELKNTYDLNGNLIRTDKYDYEYDNANNLVNTEIVSSGAEFDALNHKVKQIDGLGNVILNSYDSRDALIKKTDALGNITTYEYDIYGRKTKQTENPSPGQQIVTRYEYDADGQVIMSFRGSPILSNFIKTSYEYNALQKCTKKVLAPGTALERVYLYNYDKTGLLKESVMPNLLSASYSYNHGGQVTRIDYDNSKAPAIQSDAAELFVFDAMGRTIKATNDKSELRYVYDSFGRIITEEQDLIGTGALRINRSFDFLNNPVKLIYPSSRTLEYQYDLAGRQLQISDIKRGVPNVGSPGAGIKIIIVKSYVGLRERLNEYENGSSTLYQYDRNGRIISMDHRAPNTTSLLHLVQLYDKNGNRACDWQAGTEATTASGIYNYDGLNRLTRSGHNNSAFPIPANFSPFSIPGQSLSGQSAVDAVVGNTVIPVASPEPAYDYDEWNNRVSEKSATVNKTEHFDDLGKLTNLTYDLNGNVIKSGTRTFKYNQHNQLVLVTDAGLNFACTYDANGRRILTNDGSKTRRFAYDSFAEIASYENALIEEYIISSQPDGRVAYAANNKDHFIHHDLVGSTRLITDDAAGIVGRFDYEPYGRSDIRKNFPGFRYLFMGREWDELIKLYHFRARHYDVETGRFLQNDPVENTNARSLYEAFGSNPLIFTDPMGGREKLSYGSWMDGIQTIHGGNLFMKPWESYFRQPIDLEQNFESSYFLEANDPFTRWFRRDAEAHGGHPDWADHIDAGLNLTIGFVWNVGDYLLTETLAPVGKVLHKVDPDGSIGMNLAMMPEVGIVAAGSVNYVRALAAARYFARLESVAARAIPVIEFPYEGQLMAAASDANFLRFNAEWAQSAGPLVRGQRLAADSMMRRLARRFMDTTGFTRAGRAAMHPLDSIANPFINAETNIGSTYYFGNASVNSSFGAKLANRLNAFGIKVGDKFYLNFTGWPSYDLVPPMAPQSSPPNL